MNNSALEKIQYSFKFVNSKKKFEDLWRMKSSAREAVREWLVISLRDLYKVDVISNSCAELIENCIKYSDEGSVCGVNIELFQNNLIIDTENVASLEHISKLKEQISILNKPNIVLEELYLEKIKRYMSTQESGLGFYKILMETRGHLELNCNDRVVQIKLIVELDL